ncbi:Tricarboxylate transport protein TctC [plant metagenome]|uniref:Tricarboxylate transport protein TctC n=1 Tax=plant metagenome TaxID=1297885 RepID=A0A484PMR8_9ZZZZ
MNVNLLRGALASALSATLAAAALSPAAAAEFPSRAVSIVVPFSAGGPTDKVVRDLAVSMSKSLGQTVVVENVTGAGGTIGTRKVAMAPPDGYMVLVHTMGMSTAPSLYKNLGFDVLKDFDYIGQVVDVPMVILGSKGLKENNFSEMLDTIRKHPGKVSIGHAGPGSAAHLCTLLFENQVKSKMVSVPYKGSAPALSDLIGGQIDLVCDQTTSTAGQMQGGMVKPFAITTIQRATPFPDLMTADEQGLKGFDMRTWHGMYAPKGLPPQVKEKLVKGLQDALADPSFKQKMTDLGAQVVAQADATPESLQKKLGEETARWAEVISASGIKPN